MTEKANPKRTMIKGYFLNISNLKMHSKFDIMELNGSSTMMILTNISPENTFWARYDTILEVLLLVWSVWKVAVSILPSK